MNNFDLYLNTHVFFGREAASNIPQNINCYCHIVEVRG